MKKKRKLNILVTSGSTIEPIDAVRFISNFSTGLMGHEIAKEALLRGHNVRLVTGRASVAYPRKAGTINVLTAGQMRQAVERMAGKADCLVMAAAVCDFRPRRVKSGKIKKAKILKLELVKNPDILAGVKKSGKFMKVGFSLETEKIIRSSLKKMKAKDLDLVVANAKTPGHDPFGGGKKDFIFIGRGKKTKRFKGISKRKCARLIIKEVERFFDA